jgi:hypothetical protein
MPFNRVAAIAGSCFVVAIIVSVGLLGGDELTVDDSPSEVRSYLASDEAMHRWSVFFGAVALPFAAIFFAGVVNSLLASDREHGEAWAVVALMGSLFMVAAAGVGDVLLAILFFRGGEGLDDSTILALQDGQRIAYAGIGPPVAILMVAVAVSGLQHRTWPAWHAVLGLVGAAASAIAALSVVSPGGDVQVAGLFAFPALLIWSLLTSVVLFRAQRVQPQGLPAARAPAGT